MLDKEKVNNLNKQKTHGFTVCGCCYNEFIKQAGSIYKLVYKGKTFNFCSYTCYRDAQLWKENNK